MLFLFIGNNYTENKLISDIMADDVVIVSGVRTPIGKFGGALKNFSAIDLGAIALEHAVRKSRVAKSEIDQVILGNVLSAGLGQNVARQCAMKAGLPISVDAYNINMVCGSGLRAITLGALAIRNGESRIVVAGGTESMTNAPYLLSKARFGYKLFNGAIIDSLVKDGLWDSYNDFHMGMCGELTAEKYGITREACDTLSILSHQRSNSARTHGQFKEEIVPIVPDNEKEGNKIIDSDEGIRSDSSMEKLSRLPPAFKENGVLTAGNSSQISDGSAAIIMMSRDLAEEKGIKPLCRIVDYDITGVAPSDIMEAPILGTKKLLEKCNLCLQDIDLIEHNEAFASGTLAFINELGVESDKINVNGGAVALGHPIGASGTRILVSLIHALQTQNKKRGLATLCVGGGHAVSMIIER